MFNLLFTISPYNCRFYNGHNLNCSGDSGVLCYFYKISVLMNIGIPVTERNHARKVRVSKQTEFDRLRNTVMRRKS